MVTNGWEVIDHFSSGSQPLPAGLDGPDKQRGKERPTMQPLVSPDSEDPHIHSSKAPGESPGSPQEAPR